MGLKTQLIDFYTGTSSPPMCVDEDLTNKKSLFVVIVIVELESQDTDSFKGEALKTLTIILTCKYYSHIHTLFR